MYLQLPQPANTYIGIDDMSLPAVGAQFDTSGVKKLTSSSTSNTSSAIDVDENFDISDYKMEKEEHKKTLKNDFGAYFETYEKKVVNFATCKLEKPTVSALDMLKSSSEPSFKKRKVIKIKPTNFNFDSSLDNNLSSPSPTCSTSQKIKASQPENTLSPQEFGIYYLKKVKTMNPFFASYIVLILNFK